jgi:hypothetical protein
MKNLLKKLIAFASREWFLITMVVVISLLLVLFNQFK